MRLEWSVLTKNTMLCPWPGLELGPLHLETSALTMRPPHLPHRLQDVNNQMERLNTTASKLTLGLEIHPGKTKVIRINAGNHDGIEEFRCLSSLMTGGTNEEIIARRKRGTQPFAMISPV